jgi:stage II sporulation protein D
MAMAAAALLANACGGVRPRASPESATGSIRVGLTEAGETRVERVPLEEYVLTTVLAEFGPPRGTLDRLSQMLEVQALINRTYAVAHRGRHAARGFDVCASTHCQLYRPAAASGARWMDLAAEAVRRSAGTVLWFESGPAHVLYHADCGGHTSGAQQVWGGAAPGYLSARPDDGAAASAHRPWNFRVEGAALRRAVNADRRTNVGARLDGVHVLRRDAAGRAELVVLQGERQPLVRGEELRGVLVRAFGSRSVRSTLFEIRRDGDAFVFEGRGFGHGVGLCQAGAFARISAGASPEEVLSLYFPGTKLIRLDE